MLHEQLPLRLLRAQGVIQTGRMPVMSCHACCCYWYVVLHLAAVFASVPKWPQYQEICSLLLPSCQDSRPAICSDTQTDLTYVFLTVSSGQQGGKIRCQTNCCPNGPADAPMVMARSSRIADTAPEGHAGDDHEEDAEGAAQSEVDDSIINN